MSIFNSLRDLATKVGLLRIVAVAAPQQPAVVTTRSISLKDLAMELKSAEIAALAQSPAHWNIPFEQVFDTAGLKPTPASLMLDKIEEITAPCKDLPREQAQARLVTRLAEQNVTPEAIVKEAVARDNALDAYARTLFDDRQERRRAQQEKRNALRSELAELQAKLEKLENEASLDDKHWSDWWQRKINYEQQLAAAVNCLLTKPAISIDAQLPADEN